MRKPIRKNRTTERNIPKRIYLQVGDNDFADFKELHEVTWCADKVEPSDIGYVLSSEIDKIDLNDQVQVILTEYGANILNEQNLEMTRKVPSISWKIDYKKGDIFKDSLWSLISHFGHTCTPGGEMAFKELEKVKL